jgi:dTDP-4-dehydrorhamnose reductase
VAKMKKKVLVIGSKGMAGHIIRQYLKTNSEFEIHDISRNVDNFSSTYLLDVTNFDDLSKVLCKGNYSVVINCIGILNQFAESRPDQAIILNSYLPHFLSKLGGEMGFKLIHISTDCVFSGRKGAYKETDVKDGEGFYARTKALGEVVNERDLTIRTSIIGPELKNGIGLFQWFMQQKGEIYGYNKAFWSGVTTIELSKFILVKLDSDLSGIVHLTNNEVINKFDLLQMLNFHFKNKSMSIVPAMNKVVDKTLKNTRIDTYYKVPSYENMIKEMKQWIQNNSVYYTNYI